MHGIAAAMTTSSSYVVLLNAAAGAVVGSGVTFGVLPLGTLNHFAKDMAIPIDLDAAVDTICDGHVRRVVIPSPLLL